MIVYIQLTQGHMFIWNTSPNQVFIHINLKNIRLIIMKHIKDQILSAVILL